MKIALIIVAIIPVVIVLAFFLLGQQSKSGQAPGLVSKKLTNCTDKPNCVCSEYKEDQKHYLNAIHFSKIESDSVHALQKLIQTMGGEIERTDDQYIAATFTSSIFGFVDDLEIRLDPDNRLIHFRSASRVGYSDGGANRKRIETLKQLLADQA